ncbi:hypothetical protein [Thauera sp.]|uniref:hypothetical protein n=1 Tax=Thauera sp. TaxID=1905334 RepID=UPI00257EFA80|nr:hypothetical protein [Thauera sp.]
MSIAAEVIGAAAIGGDSPAELVLEYVTTPWPVTVVTPYIRTPWPVTVQGAPEQRVTTPWPVTIASPGVVATAWPVRVLPASVVGGLDGAASWAAAPDGLWTAVVTLGGADISDRIDHSAPVRVRRARNAAAVAEFTFFPAASLSPMSLIGRPVTIDFAQQGGVAAQRVFTGVVQLTEVGLDIGSIACLCTDRAQEIWAAMSREAINDAVGGRWHAAVSGEPDDNFRYMEERLQSVGASWALDVWQSPRVIPWRAAARSLTVRTADVDGGSLAIELPTRDSLRSRIVCRFQYRFTLLRYRGAIAQFNQPMSFFVSWYDFTTGELLKDSVQWLTSAMVESAASSLPDWFATTPLTILRPTPGSYELRRPFLDPVPPYEGSLGGTDSVTFVLPPDVAPSLATGFRQEYGALWQQSVTRDYTITVVWPEIEAQLGGPVWDEIGATLEAEFDQPDWGRDVSVEPAIPGAVGLGDASLAWQPEGADEAAVEEVMRTLLDRAWVSLWAASRSGRVSFALPCRPDLWLDTRITVEHERMRAQGDVEQVEHLLDVASGNATSEVLLAVGMPGNADAPHPEWVLPPAPVDEYVPPVSAYSCTIGTYVGGDPGSLPFDESAMVGFVTNREGAAVEGREYYPHKLTIRAPDMAAEDRDPRELVSETEIAVAIPTDLLETIV